MRRLELPTLSNNRLRTVLRAGRLGATPRLCSSLLVLGLLHAGCDGGDRASAPANSSGFASAAAPSAEPPTPGYGGEQDERGGPQSTSQVEAGGVRGAASGRGAGDGKGLGLPGHEAPEGARVPESRGDLDTMPNAQPRAALTLPNVQNCVSRCVTANQMKPEGPDRIASDCKATCKKSCLSQCDGASATVQSACRADCERQLIRAR